MSQQYEYGESSSSSGKETRRRKANDTAYEDGSATSTFSPQYISVGNGPESKYTSQLRAQLDQDSGYGSGIAGDSFTGDGSSAWQEALLQDRPTPARTPMQDGSQDHISDNDRRVLASHVHQLHYNQNRVALGRAINRTIEALKELQKKNMEWPAHYPAIERPASPQPHRPPMKHTLTDREGGTSSADQHAAPRPVPPKRAGTSLGESTTAESSAAAERRQAPEPRLITPQIAHEFSILKLDLKLGALSQTELVHSLEKRSIASLLEGKISQSVRHLLALRDRIEDTSSKVLVTGDLNAGKSTFCNALLRRKVLPEDQQPCTSIFCEVLDARENGGLEEVHAVHKNEVYDRNDESTYDAYPIQHLEKIVIDNERYMQCKVYVKDIRTIDESLLNNGVVDIALIDAPGLNSDSVKTTAVFARQEEIDVVVFVVSAANHFTLSAKEFIWQAAHEKAYIFMVVNGFDNIRDKERCQKMILEQVARLSPRTFKESAELVHFVSSNAIPVVPSLPSNNNDEVRGAGDDQGPPDDDPSPEDDDKEEPTGKHGEPGSPGAKGKGKEKEREKLQDFQNLEGALRRFVLEKRARSKLAPAKTYLLNVLGDLNTLATVNQDVAQSELDRVSRELSELEPACEERKHNRAQVSEQVEKEVEDTCADVYNHTRSTICSAVDRVAEANLGVEYPGIFSALQYAEDLKFAMLDQISASVTSCEDYGRAKCVQGVNMINSLGILHVGDHFDNSIFRAERMFQRRKDAIARAVDAEVEIWDFFDVAGVWERQEKVVGTGMAMTLVGTLGSRAIGGFGWVDGLVGAVKVLGVNNARKLAIPGVLAAGVLTIAYILSTIPDNLPPRLARKLSASLAAVDYTHLNATRIASEVRRALRVPTQNLTIGLQRAVEELQQQKDDTTRVKRESETARKYFGNLLRESTEGRRSVEAVDLEGPLPGGDFI
ncbi:MAG: hypothetical protein Q9227_004516 [Pyrenula ochraceoflavens]